MCKFIDITEYIFRICGASQSFCGMAKYCLWSMDNMKFFYWKNFTVWSQINTLENCVTEYNEHTKNLMLAITKILDGTFSFPQKWQKLTFSSSKLSINHIDAINPNRLNLIKKDILNG